MYNFSTKKQLKACRILTPMFLYNATKDSSFSKKLSNEFSPNITSI